MADVGAGSAEVPATEPGRQALAGISTRQAQPGGGHRIAPAAAPLRPTQQQRSSTTRSAPVATAQPNAMPFAIFSDTAAPSEGATRPVIPARADSAAGYLNENENWTSLTTQEKGRKENNGDIIICV
jgi:hypothetical protein